MSAVQVAHDPGDPQLASAPVTGTPAGSRRWSGRLAGDTVWATSVEALTLVSSLLVVYLISTQLGPVDYGQFVGAQALVATLGMFSYASVGQLLLQGVVRDRAPADHVFARCLVLLAGSTVVGLAIGFALRPVLFPQLTITVFTLLAVAELVGSGLVALGASYLQALDDYRRSVVVRLLLMAARALAVLVLAVAGGLSLAAVAWSFSGLSALAALAVLVDLRRHAQLRFSWRRPTGRDVRDTLSFAGALLSFSVHEDADKILMVRLADPTTAGLYAAAYRAVQVALAPLKALVAASHRRFLQHDPARRHEHVERSLRFTAAGAGYGLVAAVAVFLAAPLLPLVLGEEYAGSQEMVRLLAVLVVLRSLGVFSFNGLMGLRAHGARLTTVMSAAAVAAVLCVIGIAHWSWRGGVVATLVAECVFAAVSWTMLLVLQRRHDARLDG